MYSNRKQRSNKSKLETVSTRFQAAQRKGEKIPIRRKIQDGGKTVVRRRKKDQSVGEDSSIRREKGNTSQNAELPVKRRVT